MENGMIAAIERLWPFGAFLMTSILAFVIGRERQRWQIDALGKEFAEYAAHSNKRMDELAKRLEAMERANMAEATSIATVVAKQEMLLSAFGRIEMKLDGKVDK